MKLLAKIITKIDVKELKKLKKELEETKDTASGLITTIGSLTKIVQQTTAYTDKYITSQKVLAQTFGNVTEQINIYRKSLANMTGISETSISKSLSLFGQMSTTLGMTTDVARDFSMALTDMSAKLSMLFNVDFEQSAKSLLDAIKGESSTLATLTGIVIKNQSLQNTLDNLGIEEQASEITGASLAMLQYITIARQLTVTNEELQKTVNDVAFQKEVLKNQIQNVYNAFGNLLYPILQDVLPVLNAILIVVSNIVNAFARLIGFTGEVANSTGNVANVFEELSSSVEKANNSTSRSLRGFDKLNNITTPSAKSNAFGGGIDPRLLEEFNRVNEEMLNVENKATRIAEKIMEWLGFTKDVTGLWEWSAETLLQNIGNWLANLFDPILNFFSDIWNSFLKTVWLPIKDTVVGIATFIYDKVIKPIIDFFAPIFQAISDVFGHALKTAWDIVSGIGEAIWSIVSKVREIFAKIVEIFVALGTAFYTNVIEPIVKWLKENIFDPVLNFFIKIGTWFYEHVISPIWNKIVWLKDKAVGIFKTIGTFVIDFIGGGIKAVINGVLFAIEKTINTFIKAINGAINLINKIPGVEIKKITELSIPRLANGGFVDEGQLFVAREAGAELVGSMNGKTAVANNDQIVKGIENGVARGMVKALSSSEIGGNPTFYVKAQFGDEEITDWIRVKQNQNNRQFGY